MSFQSIFSINLMITSSRCFFPTQKCLRVTAKKTKKLQIFSQSTLIHRNHQKINQTKNIDWKSSCSWLNLPQVSFNVDLPPGRVLLISSVLLTCFSKLRFCLFARSECPEDTFTHLYLSAFHQLTDLLMSNQARLCSLPVILLTRILSRESNSIKSPNRHISVRQA